MKLLVGDHVDCFFIDVDAMNMDAAVGEHDGCRQSDIAESDDAYVFIHVFILVIFLSVWMVLVLYEMVVL